MQMLRLRALPRWKKGVAAMVLLFALLAGYRLLAVRGVAPLAPLPGTVATTVLASPQDAAVYQAARQFIEALVADERERVLSMLSEGHRTNWTDASFLYDRTALLPGRSMRLGSYRHNVVRYVQSPEPGGATVALVTALYTVLLKNGETVEAEMRVEENMVLQRAGDLWLVAADRRKVK